MFTARRYGDWGKKMYKLLVVSRGPGHGGFDCILALKCIRLKGIMDMCVVLYSLHSSQN